jgi:hypothetical protein
VSGDFNLDEGVFVNNARDRSSGRANFTYQPGDKLDFGVNTNYIRDRVSLPLSDDAGGGVIISATRGQPGRTYTQNGLLNTRGWNINLPEIAHQYDNRTETDRYITSARSTTAVQLDAPPLHGGARLPEPARDDLLQSEQRLRPG